MLLQKAVDRQPIVYLIHCPRMPTKVGNSLINLFNIAFECLISGNEKIKIPGAYVYMH